MPDALTTPAAQASPATTVPPPLGPPSDPATAGAAPGGRRFRPKALAVALLVLLVGAAAGGVMFALEQSHLTWRPHATSTASGWRIAAPHGQRVQYAALSGDHLVWVCGAYTGVFDLASGRSRLLGIARHAGAGGPVAVSREYAAWLDESRADATGPSNSIWTYRFTTSRRRRLAGTQDVGWAPALSGATLAWAHSAGDSTASSHRPRSLPRDRSRRSQRAVDRRPRDHGRRARRLVRARRVSPLLTSRTLPTGSSAASTLRCAREGTWADLMNIDLSGTTLVWRLQSSNGSGEILVHDLAGGATQPVASGRGLSGGSIDGGRVVWAQPGTGGTSIMCRRLSGPTPFVVATVATGRVSDVLVSGDTVAWIVEGGTGGFNGIETGRLAQ